MKSAMTKSRKRARTKSSDGKINIKLLIDTKANKVLFSEAGKDFVDFLFHVLSLPVGKLVKLLNLKMMGSLGDLYSSIDALDADYINSNVDIDSLMNPTVAVKMPLLLQNEDTEPTPTVQNFYTCPRQYRSSGCYSFTDGAGTICPKCNCCMSTKMTYVLPNTAMETAASSSETVGYVKGVVTYMVMDNLEVKPMSTISSITLMNKLRVKSISSLAEKEVQVGLKEGLAMLKASLETKDVLATVFLAKES